VALIKCLTQKQIADIIVCDDIPGYIDLGCSLTRAGVFRHVYFFNRKYSPGYNPEQLSRKLFGRHRKHRQLVENELKIDFRRYDNIYIFHDGTKIGRYLIDCKITFNLIEDGLDHFKHLSYVPSKLDVPSSSPLILWIKRTFDIGYLFCGQSKYCKSIEVNSKDGIEIQHRNIIEFSKAKLYNLVNEQQKQLIYKIFLGNNKLPETGNAKTALIFTCPLYPENFVKTKEMHIEIYRDLITRLQDEGYQVFIKPHPRDEMDYAKLFNDVEIITKEIPSEILNYNPNLHFNKAVAIASASIKTVEYADEIENLEYDYLYNYADYLTDWLKASFEDGEKNTNK